MKPAKCTDEEKAAKAIFECINNAENFLVASEILLNSKNYREAFLLALYAGEEVGRVPLIFNFPIHSKTKDTLKKWQKRYNDHTEKFSFLRNLERTAKKIIPTEISNEDTLQKNKRLEISYTDYKNGEFIAPVEVKETEANDFIKKVRMRIIEMRERHPSLKLLITQLNNIQNLPKTKKELEDILKSNGFSD